MSSEKLRRLCEDLDGQSYGALKRLKNSYQFSDFQLFVNHIQGDPFAEPSWLSVRLPHEYLGIDGDILNSKTRQIAARDYVCRILSARVKTYSKNCGSGKSGLFRIDEPLQTILDRSAVIYFENYWEVRFQVGMPANGRRIRGRAAATILCDLVPEWLEGIRERNLNHTQLRSHVDGYEDYIALQQQLTELGLVAFIANGSRLARRSGIDDRPLENGQVEFVSPAEMELTLNRPNSGAIKGMAIPHGVSLIVGGGFHGKSTLLRAVERGVYAHLPGDGREWVVTEPNAVKIRAEDGRSVSCMDISSFINNLPGGQSTSNFSTLNASGSTSQAASIVEAIEIGAKVLLIDEDTSATNFMIRDSRMQQLVSEEFEPITPFVDRAQRLAKEFGVSSLIVIGGSGDYLDIADTVIAMKSYEAFDYTAKAKDLVASLPNKRRVCASKMEIASNQRRLNLLSVDFSGRRGQFYGQARGVQEIEIGREKQPLHAIEQIVDASQVRAMVHAFHYLRELSGDLSLRALRQEFENRFPSGDFWTLAPAHIGNISEFRCYEWLAVLNRFRYVNFENSST